jgi:hypothetical protein
MGNQSMVQVVCAEYERLLDESQAALTVQKASSAGWMKKNGSIVFSFLSVQMPDGTSRDIHSTVGGIQAERSEGLTSAGRAKLKLRPPLSRGFSLPLH